MNNSKLKKALNSYTVGEPSAQKIEKTKELVMSVSIPKSAPVFSPVRFLKSQLHTMRKSFWLICIIYLAVVLSICFFIKDSQSVIALCSATPFLTVAAVPTLFYNSNALSMELESSCLYKPKTVFAAKTVICGAFELSVVSVCSVLCAFWGDKEVKLILIMGFLSFLLSAVITLVLCTMFKTQTGVLISVGLFCCMSGVLLGSNEAKAFVLSLSFNALLAPALVSSILLIAVLLLIFKKYDYERMGVRFGY